MTLLPDAFLARPIAHRALHDVTDGRPENSRAAIRAAIDAGYGIEMDLQLSSDGQAMVFHDYDLARLALGSGPIRQLSADALGAMNLRGSEEGIPTLPEVLDIVQGRVPLLIEIKDQDGALGADVGTLEQATIDALAGYQGDVALMSFNPHSVAKFATALPDMPRGLVTCDFSKEDWQLVPAPVRDHLRDIPDFDALGCDFISHDRRDLTNPAVVALRGRGVPILCWTVRSPEQEAIAREIADNITFEGYAA